MAVNQTTRTIEPGTAHSDVVAMLKDIRLLKIRLCVAEVDQEKRVGIPAVIRSFRLLRRIERDLKNLNTLLDKDSPPDDVTRIMSRPM